MRVRTLPGQFRPDLAKYPDPWRSPTIAWLYAAFPSGEGAHLDATGYTGDQGGMGAWAPSTITAVLRELETSTRPLHVLTDAGDAMVKLPDNPKEGPHALACDLIGTRLAEWLGLVTFDLALLPTGDLVVADGEGAREMVANAAGGGTDPRLVAAMRETLKAIEQARGGSPAATSDLANRLMTLARDAGFEDCLVRAGGLALASRKVEGQAWGGDEEQLAALVNPEHLAGLVLLDTWTRNPDRHTPTRCNLKNVFFDYRAPGEALRLVAMDFTESLRCGRCEVTYRECLSLDQIRDERAYGLFPSFRSRVTEERLSSYREKLGGLNKNMVKDVLGEIPTQWSWPAQLLDRTADFLADRGHFLADRRLPAASLDGTSSAIV